MRVREFILGEWTVCDDTLVDIFDEHSCLFEGADQTELEALSLWLDENDPRLNLEVGSSYYPMSCQAVLTTLDPEVPAFLNLSVYPSEATLVSADNRGYVFERDGKERLFPNKQVTGGNYLKQTLVFSDERAYDAFMTFFVLRFSGKDWKIKETHL